MSSTADAVALAQILGDLSTLLIRDVVELFRQYGSDPEFASILLAAFPGVVGPYLQASAMTSAQMYDESAPELDFKATPAPEMSAARLAGSVRWALYAPGGAKPVDRLAGAAQRLVFDASRQTTLTSLAAEYDVPISEVEEPGTMWARHASANACSFCKVMATRGAVFRSGESATRVVGRSLNLTVADQRALANGTATREELLARRETYAIGRRKGQTKTRTLRGKRKYGDKFHDNCHCVAVAVRPGQAYEPPAYVERWEQDYQDAWDKVPNGTSYDNNGVLKAVVSQMDKASK